MVSVPVAGQIIKASDMFNLVTFTPTWTNFTTGSGAVNEGWYQQIGSMILWGIRLEMGTSPSYSASILLTMPVNAYTGGGASLAANYGSWSLRTGSTSTYAGEVVGNATDGSNAKFAGVSTNDQIGRTTTTGPPIAPASGQVLSASGCYRAA